MFLFVIIGIIDFQIAILIGAVASGIHVTRQSVELQDCIQIIEIYFMNI